LPEPSCYPAGLSCAPNARLLEKINPPNSTKRPLRDLAAWLYGLGDESGRFFVRPEDPGLRYLTTKYLSDSAETIQMDLDRIYKDLTGINGEAKAHEYEYAGTLDPD
jgi:hypothetical protein